MPFNIDPAYAQYDVMSSKMVQDIWRDKYRWADEKTLSDTFHRVVHAIYENDKPTVHAGDAFDAMLKGLWIPGGRILAGAGTEKRVTLMNCYVNAAMEDSMEGICDALNNTMFTLQQGGGIGTDFSPLRPEGAILRRTHSKASGPIPFMHTWDAASRTIRSAGDRRGAMMGTISDTHPDMPKFVLAKTKKGALEQFNVSVLVSDAFMEAVKEDNDWLLYHPCEPLERIEGMEDYDFELEGVKQYVYSVWSARSLWELITKNTYEYSEPGVIFVDRINDLNNLHYCEDIRCTNPCGEQPLPPHGTCNLGHINLARCVRAPFTPGARVDHDLIREVARMGVRFLDNVIDVTKYPLDEQAQEEYSKRRLGLGYTGLADLLAQIGVRYGTPDAVRVTEEITRTICLEAYTTSVELAKERGAFPLFDRNKYLSGFSFVNTQLPQELRRAIYDSGIRNSLLMTIAPVGTGSIICGNVASGGEPHFLHRSQRKVLKSTPGFKDEWEYYIEYSYSAALWHALNPSVEKTGNELPDHMICAGDLTIEEHIAMQAAAQRWIDASISKTINVPKETSYDDFVRVYDLAYTLGCKGCTTYRPSDIRGSILSDPDAPSSPQRAEGIIPQRGESLEGRTYKIQWPSLTSAIYLTINHDGEGRPFEVFLNSKDAKYHDWTTALTVMITSIFRQGGDISFVARELQQVQSLHDGTFKEGQHHPSLIAYIGHKLEQHINSLQRHQTLTFRAEDVTFGSLTAKEIVAPTISIQGSGEKCPQCHTMALFRQEGCKKCVTCGFTTCG
jgi:ribonucleoside-diphosphate reductase alpha chain